MSPSLASAATKAGSFFSSPLWKRVFSSSRTSPSFIAATASSAVLADAVLGEGDRAAEHADQRRHDRLQRHTSARPALGPAEMGEQDHLAALAGDFRDGRRDGAMRRVVGDLAVGHRDVEVDADEHALALQVGVVEGAEGCVMGRADLSPASDQLAHRHGGVGHAVGEAPLVVVPGEDADELAVDHLGLVEGEGATSAGRG